MSLSKLVIDKPWLRKQLRFFLICNMLCFRYMEDHKSNSLGRSSSIKQRPSTPNRFFEQEYIRSLNEPLIVDLFKEFLKKAGREDRVEQFIPFNQIRSVQDLKNKRSGSYYAETHEIELNKEELLQDEVPCTKSMVLAVLIHEELHAVTNNGSRIDEVSLQEKRQTGFQEDGKDIITGVVIREWEMFNEGLTELIADDLFSEYIKRTGDGKDFDIRSYGEYGEKSTHQTYINQRFLVNEVFLRVSKDTGISLDIVREAFVQAYLTGFPLLNVKAFILDISGASVLNLIENKDNALLEERRGILMTKYMLANAKTEEELERYGKDFITSMCTNYLKRSLV